MKTEDKLDKKKRSIIKLEAQIQIKREVIKKQMVILDDYRKIINEQKRKINTLQFRLNEYKKATIKNQ